MRLCQSGVLFTTSLRRLRWYFIRGGCCNVLATSHFTHCFPILMVVVCCLINYSRLIWSRSVSYTDWRFTRIVIKSQHATVDQWAWTLCHIDVYTLHELSFSMASSWSKDLSGVAIGDLSELLSIWSLCVHECLDKVDIANKLFLFVTENHWNGVRLIKKSIVS